MHKTFIIDLIHYITIITFLQYLTSYTCSLTRIQIYLTLFPENSALNKIQMFVVVTLLPPVKSTQPSTQNELRHTHMIRLIHMI